MDRWGRRGGGCGLRHPLRRAAPGERDRQRDDGALSRGRAQFERAAEIGDARGRFPTAESLACLAGVAPATRQSGKTKTVGFRYGADRQLRDAICDFAADSRHANPWAADLYTRARARGHDHPHAVRILARAWTHIIWRCWQDHTPYDPTHHHALQHLLTNQQVAQTQTG